MRVSTRPPMSTLSTSARQSRQSIRAAVDPSPQCRSSSRRPATMRGVPTGFATSEPLTDDDLQAAGPPRYPRPSRLATPLTVTPPKAAAAAERLGLHTVGDLLEHLPRDRQEARTIVELSPGETATVVVEVRSIASRPVRRRGMRPLVEAVVADETGTMKATFFNQPWLERKYRPGHAAAAAGQVRGPQPLPRAVPRADRRGGRRRRLGGRHLPGHRGPVVDPDPRARARVARRRAGGARAAAGAAARARRAARPPGGARRRALRRPRGRPAAAGLRRAAAAPDRAAAAPRAPARGLARDAARAAGRADRALAGRLAAVRADRRPAQGDGGRRRRPHARPADAAAADGRGRLRQDRRRASTRCCARSSRAPRPR